MTIASASPLSLECVYYLPSGRKSFVTWMKRPRVNRGFRELSGISFRTRNLPFVSKQFQQMPSGHYFAHSRVSVAADYSDSMPDSSSHLGEQGYHPLEELKVPPKTRNSRLSFPEIARTTVEANSSALLLIPGSVHCEPHEQISWSEFQYVIDDYRGIYFKIFDDENILEDHEATNPVNALIGMDFPTYVNRKASDDDISVIDSNDDYLLTEDYFEVDDSYIIDMPADWGMRDTSSSVHPIYFSKCLSEAVTKEYEKLMDHPSNGVSIVGCLRPAFADEERQLRRLFLYEYDNYDLDPEDDEKWSISSNIEERKCNSTYYKLEIFNIELFSVYGSQAAITIQDFREAEPDVFAHRNSAIVNYFNESDNGYNIGLKALCKKKGISVEGAKLIGVDSLGIDVRIFSGVEVRTHRFPFTSRATSEAAVKRQIQQLLVPRSRRKRSKLKAERHKDSECIN